MEKENYYTDDRLNQEYICVAMPDAVVDIELIVEDFAEVIRKHNMNYATYEYVIEELTKRVKTSAMICPDLKVARHK